MNTKISSPTSDERRERKRLAAVEGAKALAEYQADSVAVRKNMARLRALRLAQEANVAAEDAADASPRPARKTTARKTRTRVKPSARLS